MASVTGFTAERMLAIEGSTVVDARVEGDNLILIRRDGVEIDAGDVRGPMPLGNVAPDGNSIPKRTPEGRLKGATPTETNDLVTKAYADGIFKGTELGGGIDLNTIVTPGTYTQTTNAEVSSGSNYPAIQAGVLEVFAPGSNFVWQRYTPYGGYADRFYLRNLYSGTWYPWKTFYAENDTGWVSNGLAFGVSVGWSVTSYVLRRVGSRVTGNVVVSYSGTTVTTATDANMADMNGVITMPSGWRNTTGAVVLLPIWRQGVNVLYGRATPDGTGKLDVVHGSFDGQQLLSPSTYTFMIDYYTD